MRTDSFVLRHLGPSQNEVAEMLDSIGVSSLDELIYNTIPDDIRLKKFLNLPLPPNKAEVEQKLHPMGQPTEGTTTAAVSPGLSDREWPRILEPKADSTAGCFTALFMS